MAKTTYQSGYARDLQSKARKRGWITRQAGGWKYIKTLIARYERRQAKQANRYIE